MDINREVLLRSLIDRYNNACTQKREYDRLRDMYAINRDEYWAEYFRILSNAEEKVINYLSDTINNMRGVV